MKPAFASFLLLIVSSVAIPLSPLSPLSSFGDHSSSQPHRVLNLAVRPAVSKSETNNFEKAHETDSQSQSLRTTIHPASSSEDPNKLSYLSSPLRGTETRDRQVLAASRDEQHVNSVSNNPLQVPQQQLQKYRSSALVDDTNKPKPKKDDTRSTIVEHETQVQLESKHFSTPAAAGAHSYHISPQPLQAPSHPSFKGTSSKRASPKEPTPTSGHVESKAKSFANWAKQAMRKTAKYGATMFREMKSAMGNLKSKKNSSPTPESHGKSVDAYTEDDVVNLVNDIISEIQMRSDEMRDHAQMLEATNRWDANNANKPHGPTETRDGPILYMRTKVVVSPETVVDAVMASTKKMFLSRHPKLPWSETSRLMRDVQGRLSEVLTTTT